MLPPDLVTESVKLLTPALPVLILVGKEAAKEIGKQAGTGTVEAGKRIWHWLRPHVEQQPAFLEAVREVATNPDDEDAHGALRLQMRKFLEENSHLVPEFQRLVKAVDVQQNAVEVSGTGAVGIGGNATSVSISTNVNK